MPERVMRFIPDNLPEKTGFEAVCKAVARHLYTPAGRKVLKKLRPLSDTEAVDEICRQTSEMLQIFHRDQTPPLIQLEEIGPWLERSKTDGARLPLESFPHILSHARQARLIHNSLNREKESAASLWKIASQLQSLKELEEEIERAVSDEGEIKNQASRELGKIRKSLNEARHTLRKTIDTLFKKATRSGMASDEGPTIRGGRMVIPIKAEYKRKIDGFVHDLSSSGQTVYLEPVEALQLNNDIRQLEAEEKREIERILLSLTRLVGRHRHHLGRNDELMGELDLIHGRTRLGLSWDGVLPVRSKKQGWKIIRARNPDLLMKNRQRGVKEEIVPLDLQIREEEGGIIISGPNAGGKSVAIKTVAALSAMYQSGIPLPLHPDSEFPVVSGLYLDMGDEQSIEHDLSTFSSRLKWMQTSLGEIDRKSLVLIDEAGTGTDPEEGGALFQAFMEEVLDKGAHLIATTHHGALKVFAHDHPKLSNGAMEFDQKTLAPTYRFREGAPGSSYAFEIAERMQLPDSILIRARSLLGKQRDRMAELLIHLEQELQSAEDERTELHASQSEAERLKRNFLSKTEEFDRERQKRLEEAYRQADQIMSQANRKIEQAVEKISTAGDQDREKIRQARHDITEHKKSIRKNLKRSAKKRPAAEDKTSPKIGDMVHLSGGDTTGELLEIDGNKAVILAGGIRIRTDARKIEKSHEKPGQRDGKAWTQPARDRNYTAGPVGPSISLRGMRGDEAVKELMLYLDKAVTAGLNEVEVIHGKGEGILRALVHEHLEKRKEVKNYEQAPWERGGAGCTVVYLR